MNTSLMNPKLSNMLNQKSNRVEENYRVEMTSELWKIYLRNSNKLSF